MDRRLVAVLSGSGPQRLFKYFGGSDPRLSGGTYSGASVKTYVDASGVVQYAPMNLLTYSEDFTNGAWSAALAGSGSVTVSAPAITGPSIGSVAQQIVFVASGADRAELTQSVAGRTTGEIDTASIYVKAAGAGDVGKVLVFRGSAGGAYSTITLTADWQRATTTETAAGTTIGFGFGLRPSSAGSSGTVTVYVSAAQHENNPKVTSYLKTTTTAVYAPRFSHYVNGQGPCLLLEGSRQNLVKWSRDLTNVEWTKRGTAGAALTATGIDGVANSATAFTGVAANAGVGDFFNNNFTVASGVRAEPSFWINRVSTSGTLKLVNGAGGGGDWSINMATVGTGWQRITRSHAAVTINTEFTGSVGNTMQLQFYCSAGAPLAFAIDGIQCELGTFPSSYIPTTSAAITRAADSLSFAFAANPQAQTVYADVYDLGTQLANAGVYWITDASVNTPYTGIQGTTANSYKCQHHNGSASVSSQGATADSIGDRVEHRGILLTTGAAQIGISVNGAAEVVASATGANTLAANWANTPATNLYINSIATGSVGFGAFRSVKVLAGIQSMATCRAT